VSEISSQVDPRSRIRRDISRVAPSVVEAARKYGVATLHEAAGRIGALPSAIKPAHPTFRVCGPAVTAHGPAGDNLWLHHAIYAAQPGDVLVVSVSGGYEYGYWGEIMSTAAKVRGLGGLVIDGCVRDGALLGDIGFPVFARGLCIRGTGKDTHAIGWVNAPVLLNDIVVAPGDLIVGDTDGVVALPRERAAEIVEASHHREIKEAKVLQQLEGGATTLEIYQW
jgi:4-hydroxy-4-methyl-2-oxoglutarate aldolase